MPAHTLAALNQMGQSAFTNALGEIFEQTPAIAHQTWSQRPFASVEALHQAMITIMQTLPSDQQLALIRAHPDLGTKAKMAQSSVQEQASVGLRSEEHTSELQSRPHISYAVFCLKKKKNTD